MFEQIIPETKDFERAEGLRYKHGSKETKPDNSAYEVNAQTMANAIKDKDKLIRRAKAVVATYGCYKSRDGEFAWRPFYLRMLEMGFSTRDLAEIERYKKS